MSIQETYYIVVQYAGINNTFYKWISLLIYICTISLYKAPSDSLLKNFPYMLRENELWDI